MYFSLIAAFVTLCHCGADFSRKPCGPLMCRSYLQRFGLGFIGLFAEHDLRCHVEFSDEMYERSKFKKLKGDCIKQCPTNQLCLLTKQRSQKCIDIGRTAVGSNCLSGVDCHVINSTCFRGICACIPGYSFSKSENTCVRTCRVYGKTMSLYPGLGIQDYNKVTFYNIPTVLECVQACVTTTDFLCLSIEFSKKPIGCNLQAVGFADVPDAQWAGDINWILGSRDCGN